MRISKTIIAALTASGIALSAGAALAEGDPTQGEKDFKKKCDACHSLKEGKNKIGPSLFNIVGRQTGTAPGYKFSPDYVEAGQKGLKWDPEQLVAYLENPSKFLAANLKKARVKSRMRNKFKKIELRENIVAYLQFLQKK